ncbi:MAG: peptide-methionine (R)-S-oxide reductase MsrB [Pseudomonadota bacterium]
MKHITRRRVTQGVVTLTAGLGAGLVISSSARSKAKEKNTMSEAEEYWANLTEDQWKERLTPEQFRVLRKEGTERAGSSPLNDEKRAGTYSCAGCELPLFSSDTKFDSGTGWPSFYEALPNAIDTKTDYKLIYPRTEYHCRRCGGHQGHVFKDGPQPTGLRYCNNGVALKFIPAEPDAST